MTIDRTAERLQRETIAAADLLAALRIDDDDLAHDMVEGETSFLEAIAAALAEIDDCEIVVDGCKAKESQIADRRHRSERRIEKLRAAIEQAMCVTDLPQVKLPTATLTIKAVPPKPIVTDEAAIPSEFWKPQPPKLDRAALNKAAKDRPVPGVEMSNGGVALQVRRV